MDGNRGNLAEFVLKKRDADYDFSPHYMWAENNTTERTRYHYRKAGY